MIMSLETIIQLPTEFKEVKAVFDDKQYLENIYDKIVGKLITGYSLSEQTTTFIWHGKKEQKTNYVASTIVPSEDAKKVVVYLHNKIRKKWQTPMIQVTPCYVNTGFEEYIAKLSI